MLLWFLPPLALAAGAIVMVLYARRRGNRTGLVSQNEAAPLTSEEQAELSHHGSRAARLRRMRTPQSPAAARRNDITKD
jgi:cytochrome c-type biogenesis protein CcmH/NrfF